MWNPERGKSQAKWYYKHPIQLAKGTKVQKNIVFCDNKCNLTFSFPKLNSEIEGIVWHSIEMISLIWDSALIEAMWPSASV